VLLAPPAASPKKASAPGVRITSPAEDGLVRSGTATVRVRTPAGVKRLAARFGTKRVDRSFKRVGAGRWRARLRSSAGVKYVHVSARVGGRTRSDHVEFAVGRRSPGFLRLGRVGVGSNGQVAVGARTRRAAHGFQVWLNGRPVTGYFDGRGSRLRVAHLDADQGLRHGRNRLLVEAFGEDGAYARTLKRFRVRRSKPLAGAGRNRTVDVRRAVRLSAKKSRRGRPGSKLRYRWTIYRRPRGSHPKLRGARTSTPRLVADRHGNYRLRLQVREQRGGAASSAVTVASDEAMVNVTPADAPIGVKIDTIPGPGKGVTIDGDQVAGAPANGVQAVVITRATRELISTASYDPASDSDLNRLQGLVNGTGLDKLVILTGGGRPSNLGSKQGQTLMKIIKQLGGTDRGLTSIGNRGLGRGQWSIIGANGFPSGSATQNIRAYPGSSLGTLQGRLAMGELGYTFVFPEFVDFDTGPTLQNGNGSNNRTYVGDQHWDSGTFVNGVQAGFHVVALDQDTLEPVKNMTIVTNDSRSADLGRDNAAKALAELRPILANSRSGQGPPVLVLVTAVNSPYPDGGYDYSVNQTNHWFDLQDVFAVDPYKGPLKSTSFGGTRDIFATQPGTGGYRGGYALVGGTNLPGYAQSETSTVANGGPGRLQGMLSRNRQAQYTAQHFNQNGGVDDTMFKLAYQDPQPWPASDTPGRRAANSYLATQLGLPYEGDIRINYYQAPSNFSGGNQAILRSRLADSDDSQYIPCPPDDLTPPQQRKRGISEPFANADCNAVKNAIIDELPQVGAVIQNVSDMQQIFVAREGGVQASVANVDEQIKTRFIPPPKPAGVNWFDFTSGIFLLGDAVAAEVPGAGLLFGLGEAGVELAAAFSDDGNSGGPRLPIPDQIDATAANVGKQVQDTLDSSVRNLPYLRNILVSDYAKLSTTAGKIKNGSWDFSNASNQSTMANGINKSAEQRLWAGMLPAGYPNLWKLRGSYTSTPGCGHKAPDTDYYRFITDYDGNGGWEVNTRIVGTGNWKNNPPSSITKDLFKPIVPDGGVGLERMSFYQRNFTGKETC